MGEWYKVEPRPYSPCDNCEIGHHSISQRYIDGELYQKDDDCHENCQIYKDWCSQSIPCEHFLGDNIRDAIRIIKG